jgi:HAE1 family hydrophobic/amphiphilic exporter-1
MVTLIAAFVVFVISLASVKFIPKTFMPAADNGEFVVSLDLPPGTSLDATNELAKKVDDVIRRNKEVVQSVMMVGTSDGDANLVTFFVGLVPAKQRKMNTSQFKEMIRDELKPFAAANPMVKDVDMFGGGIRPFNVNLIGDNYDELQAYSQKVYAKLKGHPALKDVDINYREGKPELQVKLDQRKGERMGISSVLLGSELRAQVEGVTPAVFRENGREYDIRVRLQEDQRDLKQHFNEIFVPNINFSIIPITEVANPVVTKGPAAINRIDRGRYISVMSDIAPEGPGMSAAMADIDKLLTQGELKTPPGIRYQYYGQAESFKELIESILLAGMLATLFIYFVLVSLYESFVIPLTIMLVLPLATSGAFLGLLATGRALDIFSMIGCIMLLGVATKNSILLVDYIKQKVAEGVDEAQAIIMAGKVRLRPILMTSFALIAGMLPVAIGLNEASSQRTSMGTVVIGGLVTSTLLTLVVVPAAYSYIERFRVWTKGIMSRIFAPPREGEGHAKPSKRAPKQKPATPVAEPVETPTIN